MIQYAAATVRVASLSISISALRCQKSFKPIPGYEQSKLISLHINRNNVKFNRKSFDGIRALIK